MRPISAGTRLIALLGDPVGHSLSPVFQNAAIQAAGSDAVYLALRTPGELVSQVLRGIAFSGGAGNVTVPHKALAAAAVDRRTEAVEATGACNTFWAEGDEVWGDNTDVVGFLRAAQPLVGGALDGKRILLLGAGGSASAVAWGLIRSSSQLTIVNRTRSRAEQLVERLPAGPGAVRIADLDELAGERFDLVVNATSVGLMAEDPHPLPADGEIDFAAAMDLVYKPDRTGWVRSLRSRGIAAEDGLEMLIHQGATAFERWFGVAPDMSAIRASLPNREG